MNRTGRVHFLDHIISGYEIFTKTRLVAKAPYDDGRVVEVAAYHPADAGKMGIAENRIVSKGSLAIAHSVRFNIRFVDDIEAIFVAE